ncbi:MAG: hypothetical protein AB1632_09935 [Nitrospirota bacterium]
MKKMMLSITISCLFLLFHQVAFASDPVLNFSDLTNGPRTGNGDGQATNHGAIVTIWGNNLGATQGTSKVYIGIPGGTYVEAAHYYYWKNADGILPSGPADLYSRHKMQEIAFSIPSTAPTGSQKIWVVVNGVSSNQLDFNVTTSGNIYFVKTTGSDTNPGTWSNPWRSMDYAASAGRVNAGDVVYFCDGVQETDGFRVYYIKGTPNNLIGLIAYPGGRVLAQGYNYGIGNHSVASSYVVIAKLVAKSEGSVITHFAFSREIGNEVTDITCASCSCGAMGGAAAQEGSMFFGNYVHDYGGACSGNQTHPTYFTLREAVSGKSHIQGFEFAWNYLKNNDARSGIHLYDEHGCGGYDSVIKIHNNVVENGASEGIGIIAGGCDVGYTIFGNIEIYNNLLMGNGKSNSQGYIAPTIVLQGQANVTNVKLYNNTIYGYGYPGCTFCEAIAVYNSNLPNLWFKGTWEFKNNIIVDTNNVLYSVDSNMSTPAASDHNLWYNGGDGNPANPPAWDSSPITTNPLFENPGAGDFRLQSTSPARNSGTSTVSPIVTRDFYGGIRVVPYDIGAANYSYSTAPASPVVR